MPRKGHSKRSSYTRCGRVTALEKRSATVTRIGKRTCRPSRCLRPRLSVNGPPIQRVVPERLAIHRPLLSKLCTLVLRVSTGFN
jgi:hypothetical protein